jgi:hypothetical protein
VSLQPVPVPGVARPRGSVPLLGLLVVVLAAGCTTGGLPASSAATISGDPLATVPAITSLPAASPAPPGTATPRPTEVPGPPSAAITAGGGGPIPGQLGGFTWQDMGSDAPWLVPPAEEAVHGAGPYMVTFAPSLLVESWTARWAPVVDGSAGDVADSGQGGPGPVLLAGPDRPGAWSLQLDTRFAGGNRGAYYWRVEVAP